MGYHYFPVHQGHFVSYDVTAMTHDEDLLQHDTSHYQIKEVVGESFEDEEGEEAHKLYRYYRKDSTFDWSMKDVWVMKLTNRTAEVVEENMRYIKMGFAISYSIYWDGNALNYQDEEEWYYDKIAEPYSLSNGVTFDSTAVVEHANLLTYIDYYRSYEVYAANVGKIHSYYKSFTINNGDTLDVAKGSELFYSAFDYGQE